MKVFIAWAVDKNAASGVVNCGEFDSVEKATQAVAALSLELAEVETEFRSEPSKRDIDRKASSMKLQQVAELGVKLGLWAITYTSKPYDETESDTSWRFVSVQTPEGLNFDLSGGSWNKENKIHASVGSVKIDDNVKAYVSDVKSYSEATPPDAYVSKDKSPELIVKDIMRRVVNNPACIDFAKRINARIESLKASRNGLAQHMETLKKMGFSFNERAGGKTYSVTGYCNDLHGVTVYDNGRISFEASLNVADIPALLALINKGA